jgi:hypothetical protein
MKVVKGYIHYFVLKLYILYMFREQKAGQNHSFKICNKTSETMEQFTYLETTLTNQNCLHEEIKSKLKSGNTCYHSAQNLLSSSLLSKNVKFKIYRTIILLLVLYGCETLSVTLTEETRLRVFEKEC